MFDTRVKKNGKIDGVWYKNQYEKLWKENNFLEHEKNILNKRIEKAVEYINGTTFFGLRSGKTFMSKYLNELLNILNGRSDENE